MTPLFHAAMTIADLVAVTVLRGRGGWRSLSVVAVAWSAALWFSAATLAVAFGHGGFAFLRLAGYGVFLHAPLVLFGLAWILRSSRPGALVWGGAGGVLLAIAIHAFFIEPTWLEVSHHEIRSPEIVEPMRLVVLADLQTDHLGDYERAVFEAILDAKPDLLLLPGDYLQVGDSGERRALRATFNEYLREIGFGEDFRVLAVRGDVEGPGWTELFAGLPVEIFEHTETVERLGLTFTALSPEDTRNRRLHVAPAAGFHVIFGHDPAFALADLPADLQIGGHTHGGQVRLPGIGPLLTLSRVPRAWAAGVTDLGKGRTLIVSRGVGMERGWAPRLRFLCRPELVVVDLLPG